MNTGANFFYVQNLLDQVDHTRPGPGCCDGSGLAANEQPKADTIQGNSDFLQPLCCSDEVLHIFFVFT